MNTLSLSLDIQEPNPEDPLNKEAAQLMISNKIAFERNVKQSLNGGVVDGKQYPKLL
jgi:ubiquitin-conjugating enzyme E2 M